MTLDETVACIGAGHAGVQLAESLRTEGFAGRIVLIDEQEHLPYSRPPLSKEFMTGTEMAPLPLKGASWYAAHDVTLHTGTRATSIDRERRRVHLEDGSALGWNHLVLAQGARARTLDVPGSTLAGIHTLRTLNDAKGLRAPLARSNRVVVVGAGFIGLEFACAARATGLDVTVVDPAGRALARSVSSVTAAALVSRLEAAGTHFSFETSVLAFQGEDHVRRVLTSNGDLDADLVVIGIGVVPRDELAHEAGLEVDGGIVVDSALLTSDPNITAVGDLAVSSSTGARTECVQNAADQARYVAQRIVGKTAEQYAHVPRFWSHLGPNRLQIVGTWTGSDNSELAGNPDGAFSIRHYRGSSLIAVESVNQPREHMQARKALESRLSVA
ncbi:FAD-dependent oxidoreductase [Nocardioides sp. NBC_00368]|uniref:NAD(P)/FAD-dependent oxidoreductase n=1 Tax=Nocardioides sp. NBC_00368 TaxID=2976000 RepID=UPI002E1F4D91